jgi:nitroimidazol reductase NimA-like FMN-containing flavoprotein (pyridoxamine 5'-phosphate oxidase superfamily)
MDEPVTELDERLSDPGAQATTWASTREALEAAPLSWVSTVRADGRPHVTPLVAVWLDEAFHFSTGPGEQKAVNLTTNPHVVLTTRCNQWDQGLDVMVEGEARRVTNKATLERLAAAWRPMGRELAIRGDRRRLPARHRRPHARIRCRADEGPGLR